MRTRQWVSLCPGVCVSMCLCMCECVCVCVQLFLMEPEIARVVNKGKIVLQHCLCPHVQIHFYFRGIRFIVRVRIVNVFMCVCVCLSVRVFVQMIL